MKKIFSYIALLFLSILLIAFSYQQWQAMKEEEKISLQLNQLRGVAKLVLWEQDFTLNNTESVSKKYFGVIETKESIHSSISGRMGFHIDLADSMQTRFSSNNDTIIIEAPLRNTYIALDLSTLNQIKESSLDPSLEIKKEEVIKNLQQKAIEEYIPGIKDQISRKDIHFQESKLSEMIGRPVRIEITSYPDASGLHWKPAL